MTHVSRRGFISSLAFAGGLSGWLGRVAAHVAEEKRAKSCILLWMSGGPSHLDTFDLKPEASDKVRGEFKPIDTSVPGMQISEHFPQLAKCMQHAAILRSMHTQESDHQLATYHMHTGYQKRAGSLTFPSLGAIASHELGKRDVPLPNFVCVGSGPRQATRSGFLGPDHQPLDVTNPDRGTDFIDPLSQREEFDRQFNLLRRFDAAFEAKYQSSAGRAHASAVERAVKLMTSDQKKAFDLSGETEKVRERYGKDSFGQGCLMARRLVEAGVPFVEVMSGGGVGWDTHQNNFSRTRSLSGEVDSGMSALIEDLRDRGVLDSTLVIWMGEFGRSPQITSGAGRNHWARAWSTVLAGGGIRGGQVIGRTDRDAAEVADRPISVTDFLGTVCKILGIDYERENRAPGVERPIPIVDVSKQVKLITELL